MLTGGSGEERMLFANVWYVAEWSENVTDQPVKVKMLGREFVLFRDGEGRAVCLSNTCCHRGASLAQGRCQNDGTVSCPFHGWRYDRDGRVRMIPSAARPTADIPPAARVDSYPVEERHGFIWVFLGDRPEEAETLFDMPENADPGWRRVTFSDTWKANIHWAKMVDLDQVHLHIVHGIPLNEDNPSRPAEHAVERLPNGFRTHIVSRPPPRGGAWAQVRRERAEVNSYLSFYLPGFTLYGRIEIGPGFSNNFYSMSTPIDEETTRMYLVAFRNFLLDPDKDKDHLERNLRNVYQDKAIAENHHPKRAPDLPAWPVINIDREDRLMQAYWQYMRELRARGWQLDRLALDEQTRNGEVRVIPSPARRADPANWVYPPVPFVPAASDATASRRGAA
jgi:phenylpropionate dioxygenase-like ring-hydroxylating dioxygenase large terminal subunit